MFIHDLLPRLSIERVVRDGKRFYKTPEGVFPSVTSVLSECMINDSLNEWKKHAGEKVVDQVKTLASARGTALHKLVEKYVSNEIIDVRKVMPTTAEYFKNIRQYLDKINIIRGIELPLYSRVLKVAGTSDLLCDWGDKGNMLIDLKSSTHVKDRHSILSYWYQTTAYALMVESCYKISVPYIGIILAYEATPRSDMFISLKEPFVEDVVQFFSERKHVYASSCERW